MLFIHKSSVDEKSQSGGRKSICNNFNGIKRLASTGSLCHTSGSMQKSIMHQHMKTRKCRGKEEIREGKRRDKGREMSESWAAGCILQSAWDTSECEFVCASVYVCLRVFGRKEAHSHPLNPMIQPSLHQAWAWEREKERQRKSFLSEKARKKRHGEEREPCKQRGCNERVFIYPLLTAMLQCSFQLVFRQCFEDAGLLGPRMGRGGQFGSVFASDGFSSSGHVSKS